MTLEEQNDEANELISARMTQLNAVLEQAERKLREMKIPRPVWYYTYSSATYGPGLEDFEQIGMDKYKGEWCLCLATGTVMVTGESGYEEYEERSEKPYRECSIVQRLTIAENLEHLRRTLVEEKATFVTDIDEAVRKVASFIDNQ